MIGAGQPPARRTRNDQRGQAMIMVVLALPMTMGMMALGIDLSSIYYHQTELSASTQAAALAGAQAMSQSGATAAGVTSVVTSYSSVSGNQNAYGNLAGISLVSGYPQFKCLSTLTSLFGTQCYGPNNSNAIVVAQHVRTPLLFFRLFGGSAATLSSVATAAMKGAQPGPYNVAIVIDTTASMNNTDSDSSCYNTRISCALNGVRILLGGLLPCQSTSSSCGSAKNGNVSNSVDRVSLFTFPPLSTATVADDYNCGHSSPTVVKYATPFPATSTYQVVGFSSDYRSSDKAKSLNASSNLVIAAGAKSGCTGLQAVGGVGTSYAQAIMQAQAALVAEQSSYSGSINIMVILGDGDSNATSANMPGASTISGTYMSTVQQCHQAVTAAQAATAAGTRVYSVAYGATSSGCSTDTKPTITPCQTMKQMASSASNFFSDYTAKGGSSSCISAAQPVTGLATIFSTILMDLTQVKLIPNGTT